MSINGGELENSVQALQRHEIDLQGGEYVLKTDLEMGQDPRIARSPEDDPDVQIRTFSRHFFSPQQPEPVVGPRPEQVDGEESMLLADLVEKVLAVHTGQYSLVYGIAFLQPCYRWSYRS